MNQHTRNIIVDSLILVAFSSLLGGLSLLVSKSFSGDPNKITWPEDISRAEMLMELKHLRNDS